MVKYIYSLSVKSHAWCTVLSTSFAWFYLSLAVAEGIMKEEEKENCESLKVFGLGPYSISQIQGNSVKEMRLSSHAPTQF